MFCLTESENQTKVMSLCFNSSTLNAYLTQVNYYQRISIRLNTTGGL